MQALRNPKRKAEKMEASADEKSIIENSKRVALKKAPKMLHELAEELYKGAPGITPNQALANSLFIMAADLGFSEAEYTSEVEYSLACAYAAPPHGSNFTQDFKKAAKLLESAAKRGNAKAQFTLANCYEMGQWGFQKDKKQAAHFLQLAADQKNSSAQYWLGLYYLQGKLGIPVDLQKGIKFLQLAVDQGYPPAEILLGCCYEYGVGVLKDTKKAIPLFLSAATSGNQGAQASLGVYFQTGNGLPQSDQEAFNYYQLAAQRGLPFAQVKLGICYSKGIGTTQNTKKAAACFNQVKTSSYNPLNDLPPEPHEVGKKTPTLRFFEPSEVALIKEHFSAPILSSSSSTSSKAEKKEEVSEDVAMTSSLENEISKVQEKAAEMLFRFATYFSNGEFSGIQKNPKRAVEFCIFARLLGSTEAEVTLASWHAKGLNGLEQNKETAAKFYRSAADKNNAEAKVQLGNCYLNGTCGLDKNAETAVSWYQSAATQGNSNGYYALAYCHENGTGLTQDLEEAKKYYSLAALKDHRLAQIKLGIFFQTGKGTSINPNKAFLNYTLAMKHKTGSNEQEYISFARVKSAICHELGFGTRKNPEEATKLFGDAALFEFNPQKYFPREDKQVMHFSFEKSEIALINKHLPPTPTQQPISVSSNYNPRLLGNGARAANREDMNTASSSSTTTKKPKKGNK